MPEQPRMRAVVTDKRPCKLGRGEIRRVPQDRGFRGIVGYHVGCPRCGFVTAVINGEEGRNIAESDEGDVSFSLPAQCVYCSVTLHLVEGFLVVEVTSAARPAPARGSEASSFAGFQEIDAGRVE